MNKLCSTFIARHRLATIHHHHRHDLQLSNPPDTMDHLPTGNSESIVTAILNSFSATSNELDATELSEQSSTRTSTAHDDAESRALTNRRKKRSALASFWKNHITVTVPGEAMRDHLGKPPLSFSPSRKFPGCSGSRNRTLH